MSASGSCLSTAKIPFTKYVVHCRDRFHYDEFVGVGSEYENKFTTIRLANTARKFHVECVSEILLEYRFWLLSQPRLMAKIKLLRAKKLGCYCKVVCHAEVIAELANGEL